MKALSFRPPHSSLTSPFVKSVAAVTALVQAAAHAAPLLEIRRTGNNVELKWPAAEAPVQLQSTASLTGGPWANVAESPTVVGTTNVLLQSIQSTPRFFRLVCNAPDAPDGAFTDTNCDGIDGNVAEAIFVATGGNDMNAGTQAAPMATLQAAIDRAATQGKDVYAGKGTYTVSGSLALKDGVSLYGQYDPANNWSRATANVTTISAGTTAVVAQALAEETHIEGFTIKAANATTAGSSSYGVRLQSSTGLVVVRYNTIEAGSGAAGSPGASFSKADGGGDGADGSNGSPDNGNATVQGGQGGLSPAGNNGGTGGSGGRSPGFGGGAGGMGGGGTSGGPGGSSGDPGGAGGAGPSGNNGANGTNGTGGAEFGTFSLLAFDYESARGTSGTGGADGKGGGGGGGGGGQTCTFCVDGTGNGGGGGGGGGSGGRAGTGGGGGGGSFGIYSRNSNALITANTILTKTGGTGGSGGSGGLGGDGGEAGEGGLASLSQIGRGGNGGTGGRGGHAGSGGGGGGGPSIGIQINGGSVSQNTNTITVGTGGNGGPGGSNTNSTAPAGTNGLSAAIH